MEGGVKMTIEKVSRSIEALAAVVNPHKEAVELVEQQMDLHYEGYCPAYTAGTDAVIEAIK